MPRWSEAMAETLHLCPIVRRRRRVWPGPQAAAEVSLVAGEAERGDRLEGRLVLDVVRDHGDVELPRGADQRLGEELGARVGERAPHLHPGQLDVRRMQALEQRQAVAV